MEKAKFVYNIFVSKTGEAKNEALSQNRPTYKQRSTRQVPIHIEKYLLGVIVYMV